LYAIFWCGCPYPGSRGSIFHRNVKPGGSLHSRAAHSRKQRRRKHNNKYFESGSAQSNNAFVLTVCNSWSGPRRNSRDVCRGVSFLRNFPCQIIVSIRYSNTENFDIRSITSRKHCRPGCTAGPMSASTYMFGSTRHTTGCQFSLSALPLRRHCPGCFSTRGVLVDYLSLTKGLQSEA
jgi:hypothetical protein